MISPPLRSPIHLTPGAPPSPISSGLLNSKIAKKTRGVELQRAKREALAELAARGAAPSPAFAALAAAAPAAAPAAAESAPHRRHTAPAEMNAKPPLPRLRSSMETLTAVAELEEAGRHREAAELLASKLEGLRTECDEVVAEEDGGGAAAEEAAPAPAPAKAKAPTPAPAPARRESQPEEGTVASLLSRMQRGGS